MKRLLALALCLLLLSVSTPPRAEEDVASAPSESREIKRTIPGPTLQVQTSGTSVSLAWTEVSGAVGYVLYYTPYPYTEIFQADLGYAGSLQVNLFEGADFLVAVRAYDYYDMTDFSNIGTIKISSSSSGGTTTDDDLWSVHGSTVEIPAGVSGKAAADQYLNYVGGYYIDAYSPVNGLDYNATWDNEVATQKQFWGTPSVAVYRVQDQANNPIAVSFMNDVILIGDYLFNMIVTQNGETAIYGILAHEWGHQLQFANSHNLQAFPLSELEADAFSGYYLAIKLQAQWSDDATAQQQMENSILGYFQMLVSVGSYNFNEPDFHGTPEQRISAGYMGMMTALKAMQEMVDTGTGGYTVDQLFQIFTEEINTVIIPSPYAIPYQKSRRYRTTDPKVDEALVWLANSDVEAIARGESKGRNLPYPDLTREEIEQLAPAQQ